MAGQFTKLRATNQWREPTWRTKTAIRGNSPEATIQTKTKHVIAIKTRASSRVIKAGSLVGVDQPIRTVGAISVISRSAAGTRNGKAAEIRTQSDGH